MAVATPWTRPATLLGTMTLRADERGGEENQPVEQREVGDPEAGGRHVLDRRRRAEERLRANLEQHRDRDEGDGEEQGGRAQAFHGKPTSLQQGVFTV